MTNIFCNFNKRRLTIGNDGLIGAYNINITSNITGDFLFGGDTSHENKRMVLLPGENITIKLPFIFGFGRIHVHYTISGLNVEDISYSYNVFFFGFLRFFL
jgi:hypothetical protein